MFFFISQKTRNKSKKGQGLSLNMVIVAVIAIAVLVVILVMFSGKTKIFSKATSDCTSKGGQCLMGEGNHQSNCPSGAIKIFSGSCSEPNHVCCTNLDSSGSNN